MCWLIRPPLPFQTYHQDIAIMETKSNANVSTTQHEKLKEIQEHQEKLKKLQAELEKLNAKVEKNEKLTSDDVVYLGELGWLSAAAVAIAAIAASL